MSLTFFGAQPLELILAYLAEGEQLILGDAWTQKVLACVGIDVEELVILEDCRHLGAIHTALLKFHVDRGLLEDVA